MNRLIEAIEMLDARAKEHALPGSSVAEHVETAKLIQRQLGIDSSELAEAARYYCREEHGTVRPVDNRRDAELQIATAFVIGVQAATVLAQGRGEPTGHVHVYGGELQDETVWSWYVEARNGVRIAQGTMHDRREDALESFRAAQEAVRNPLIDAGD